MRTLWTYTGFPFNLSSLTARIVFTALWLLCLFCLLVGSLTWVHVKSFTDETDGLQGIDARVVKSVVYDRHGNRLNQTYQNHWNLHDQLSLENIPEFLSQSVVIAEDKRFYQHSGPDWLARLSAAWQNVRSLRIVRGASTITEQVVRMLRPRPRTLWSRWLEGWEAKALEQRYSKADILEFYLNQVPYGAQRRGVQQASRYYFGRDANTLNPKEMLVLAVLVRSPSGLSPLRPNPRLEQTIDALAERLYKTGVLSATAKVRLLKSNLSIAKVKEPVDVSHFIRHVDGEQQMLRRAGVVRDVASVIHSTLDSELQIKVQKLLDTRLDALADYSVENGAVLVVDHHSNEVLCWVVGRADDSEQSFNRINAVLTPRQPGSALKPFIYALALEQGWNAATIIDDSPLQSKVGSGLHEYQNYSRRYYGPISLREALGNSLNIPAVKAVKFVRIEAYLSFLHRLGIDNVSEHPQIYGEGIALGNAEISLYELVQAYSVLARMGRFSPLSVAQNTSNPVVQSSEDSWVVDAAVASLVADILSDPHAREKEFGRHSILNFPYRTAVKTGTSSDYHDAWAIGFNDRYTAGVWMGNLNYQPMQEVTGSAGPAVVLRSVFHELNRNRDVQPLYLSDDLHRMRICRSTGEPATGNCAFKDELFTLKQKLAFIHDSSPQQHANADIHQDTPRITQPSQRLNIAVDPRIPDEAEYFKFELVSSGGVDRVDWYLNGKLSASTSSENMLWQVARGEFQAHALVWQSGDDIPVKTEIVNFSVH